MAELLQDAGQLVTKFVVAIDGPSGSGKSSVSRAVAAKLGWAHLDTGAFYRAATALVLRDAVDPTDEAAVLRAVRPHRLEHEKGVTTIDGIDVSNEIRSDHVNASVSPVSVHPQLRVWLVRLQRYWAAVRTGVVVEGRDIGSVVFPAASVKIFLTADPAERARRRAGESGRASSTVQQSLAMRDRIDSARASSPLEVADGAIEVDTTEMDFETVVKHVMRIVDDVASTDR